MLKINNNSGLFDDITHYNSENCNNRPNNTIIDTIIIHCISLPVGSYGNQNIIDLFMNNLDINQDPSFESLKDVKVSSHLLIKRDGEIIQFVPFNKCAWHAGESAYKGRKNCNEFSVGIEIQGKVDEEYTKEQYENLKEIVDALKNSYQLDDVVAHSEISPGRKNDPGPLFNWSELDEN